MNIDLKRKDYALLKLLQHIKDAQEMEVSEIFDNLATILTLAGCYESKIETAFIDVIYNIIQSKQNTD